MNYYEWKITMDSPLLASMMRKMFLQHQIMIEMKEYENNLIWETYRDKLMLQNIEIQLIHN